MEKENYPTPKDLEKSEEVIYKFDQVIQSQLSFSGPLAKSERALLKTFYLWLHSPEQKTDK